jgi:shikimate dehydrogenase
MKLFGLIGYPLSHSFSKKYFTEKFERESISAAYEQFEIPDISLLPDVLQDERIVGLNVTIPYKEKVIPYLDALDERAAEVGAVNVIRILREEEKLLLIGSNSDVVGFRESIRPMLKPHHKKALILGTGGASKAVIYGLKELDIYSKLVSRTSNDDGFTYDQLTKEIMAEYTVIVNASPVGTYPKTDEAPDIPYQWLTPNHLLYDLVYNPFVTRFLELGKEKGATTKNGQEMLELQAEEAWAIWNR